MRFEKIRLLIDQIIEKENISPENFNDNYEEKLLKAYFTQKLFEKINIRIPLNLILIFKRYFIKSENFKKSINNTLLLIFKDFETSNISEEKSNKDSNKKLTKTGRTALKAALIQRKNRLKKAEKDLLLFETRSNGTGAMSLLIKSKKDEINRLKNEIKDILQDLYNLS